MDMNRLNNLISDKLDEFIKVRCVDKKHFDVRILDVEKQLKHVIASIPLPIKSTDFVSILDLEDNRSLIKKDIKKLEDSLRNNIRSIGDDNDIKLNNIKKT